MRLYCTPRSILRMRCMPWAQANTLPAVRRAGTIHRTRSFVWTAIESSRPVGQFALQLMASEFESIGPSLRAAHARFLRGYREGLVTFGPIGGAAGSLVGYAYQTDFPGTDAESMREFLARDPLSEAGLCRSTVVSGWRCMLPHRQATTPARTALRGFLVHGIAKPDVTERRNELAELHRAHLRPLDHTNCLARGGLTDKEGQAWLGSAMVYEFPDRSAFDEFFRIEPFRSQGLYEQIDIYDWQRGIMAGT